MVGNHQMILPWIDLIFGLLTRLFFLNILDVGGFNQNRAAIISDFRTRIEDGDTFFLPYAAILETGNHIAQLHGNVKFTKAEEFVTQVSINRSGTF
jgi:hypothetical protein